MDKFSRTIRDIKSVKIQGAENVAAAAVEALKSRVMSKNYGSRKSLFSDMVKSSKRLSGTRPTEPLMRNSLKFVMDPVMRRGDSGIPGIKKRISGRAREALRHFEEAEERIALTGSRKIRKGFSVFTYCHSTSVMNVLSSAKKQGKSFIVFNTETRPLYQGRKTARDCAKMGIPVTMLVDSAARMALRKCDVMLIGSDAMTSDGAIVNKIGSEMFAIMADRYDVPVYSCMDSWKFDPESIAGYDEEIEQRSPSEVWSGRPKGVKIRNPAFERVDPDLIAGIVSDVGFYPPEVFVEEVKKAHPWMFSERF